MTKTLAYLLFLSMLLAGWRHAHAQVISARFGVEPELRVGARLSSANGKYVLIVQGDGNAVIYPTNCIGDPTCSTFDTGTSKRTSMPILRHQGDGNIVLYAGPGMAALWAAGARGYYDYRLTVSDDGAIVQEQIAYRVRWSYKTGRPKKPSNLNCSPRERAMCDLLNSTKSFIRSAPGTEKQLVAGDRLISPDGNFTLVVQGEGNVVVYRSACIGDPSCSVLSTATSGKTSVPVLRMQADGNLVLYDTSDSNHPKDLFNIGTTGSGEYLLAVQNDGNLVVYQAVNLGERTVRRLKPVAPDPGPKPEPPNPGHTNILGYLPHRQQQRTSAEQDNAI